MRIVFAVLFICVMSFEASAKCTEPSYLFTGRVTDGRGIPVEGAAVGVSWSVRGEPHGPELAITDRDGRYAIQADFPVRARFTLVGDRCSLVVHKVSISASDTTHYSMPLVVDISSSEERVVRDLELNELNSEKVLWPVGDDD